MFSISQFNECCFTKNKSSTVKTQTTVRCILSKSQLIRTGFWLFTIQSSPAISCGKKILLENPIDIKKGEWREINETVKNLTYGHTKRIYLRSTLEYPAPCSPLSQTISIYGGEGEHIYILDRLKKEFNPIGISYDEALKMTAGGIQFEGITAQARKTIFEKTFLIDNGGLKNSITPYEI